MRLRSCLGMLFGVSLLCATSLSHAQCSKDTDCKGERVCENGACVTPSAPPATSTTAPATTAAPAAAAAPAPAAAAPAAAPAYQPYSNEPPPDYAAPRPRGKRHSPGMMAGGIVMVSLVPIALLASLIANNEQNACESGGYYFDGSGNTVTDHTNCGAYDKTIYGGLIGGVVLLGAGIPMIVIGGKRDEPGAEARVSPWATPQGAGLSLRLDL